MTVINGTINETPTTVHLSIPPIISGIILPTNEVHHNQAMPSVAYPVAQHT
jgi:hypothetical protein